MKGKTSLERRYFSCSFTDIDRFAETVCAHWCIENQQHWMRDVQFGEDANRSRTNHSAQNLTLIQGATINLLRQRKLRAAFSGTYR